jgi:hypothetical protein
VILFILRGPLLSSRSLCPHTDYPTEDEQRAEQERIRVAVERMLDTMDAMDVGRCPHCATEMRTRQRVAGAVLHYPLQAPVASRPAEPRRGRGGWIPQ